MNRQTRGFISVGQGIVHRKLSKQEIHTKSSTETGLVGVSEYIPWTVLTNIFMMGQGYNFRRNIYYQDNESTMKMESNVRMSAE